MRINRSPYLYDFDDILAVVGLHVEGIVISKPIGPEDINCVSMMLSEAEFRNGTALGSTRLIPLLETARSLELAHEIAKRERVGATAKNADVARALGYVWTPDGRESLYFKSRAVMAARAAGNRRSVAAGEGPGRPAEIVAARSQPRHVRRVGPASFQRGDDQRSLQSFAGGSRLLRRA
ncbi:Hydroxymethylglutaryl-CoA lyase [Candidatus Paraburkholderia kirkii]|nr:Hydroxymethylglutaryl-CoA lyase [Candidatus Paraburkholderia kirkii]